MMALLEINGQPKVVVNVVIDQLRGDLLESYTDVYGEGGFRRLMQDSRIYARGEYPFKGPDRASAMACLMTGTMPEDNGITGLEWLDRETLQPVKASSDVKNLMVSTIGDELKLGTEGRGLVYSIAPTKDAALISGGHAADATYVVGNNDGVVAKVTSLLQTTALGLDHNPDMLNVTYSAAQTYGMDMMDVYMGLDYSLQQLFDQVEERVGKGNALFVVTGTGYAQETLTDDDLAQYKIPTGDFNITHASLLLNMYLIGTYGQGEWVEAVVGNEVYLNLKMVEKKGLRLQDFLQNAASFLCQLSGVRDVTLNMTPQRCGDLVIQVRPGWHLVNEKTHDRILIRDSYFATPIFLMGADITPERIDLPVTVDHVAPTVAKVLRIRAPNGCTAAPFTL